MRCGADTGGTFTDVVTDDGRFVKVPSTPDSAGSALVDALASLTSAAPLASAGSTGSPGVGRPTLLAHGTTVATNALLERRLAPTALITNRGFADVIEIARQDRPSLYDLWADRPEPMVPRRWRYEVSGRLGADGRELEPFDAASLPVLPSDVRSAAICLLHADLDACHERTVAAALVAALHADRAVGRPGVLVSCSSDVSPEYREYERTLTTVLNAALGPVCRDHLMSLASLADEVSVMTSAGGLLPVAAAVDLPVALLLSGPAAGVRAGAAAAAAAGFPDAVTFDMGGTSTDVCLVLGGVPEPSPQRDVAGLSVRMPGLDVHTVGSGGGSLAHLDPGGALVVGPASAGAWPGPACYGRGGNRPTVTDADLVLGRIPADAALAGLQRLDAPAARQALERAGTSAAGVVTVVDEAMVQAVRAVSVERGADPRGLALVAFGGAGPLHACAVAGALDMAAVVVPQRAGVLSAVGLLCSPPQRDAVRSWPGLSDHDGLDRAVAALGAEVRDLLDAGPTGIGGEVEVRTALDCRYAGQSHELTVDGVAAFHDEHRRRNGYDRPDDPVEVVALRARARRPPPMTLTDFAPATRRAPASGPCALSEPDCTVWVPAGWSADVSPEGAWVLRREGAP